MNNRLIDILLVVLLVTVTLSLAMQYQTQELLKETLRELRDQRTRVAVVPGGDWRSGAGVGAGDVKPNVGNTRVQQKPEGNPAPVTGAGNEKTGTGQTTPDKNGVDTIKDKDGNDKGNGKVVNGSGDDKTMQDKTGGDTGETVAEKNQGDDQKGTTTDVVGTPRRDKSILPADVKSPGVNEGNDTQVTDKTGSEQNPRPRGNGSDTGEDKGTDEKVTEPVTTDKPKPDTKADEASRKLDEAKAKQLAEDRAVLDEIAKQLFGGEHEAAYKRFHPNYQEAIELSTVKMIFGDLVKEKGALVDISGHVLEKSYPFEGEPVNVYGVVVGQANGKTNLTITLNKDKQVRAMFFK